MGWYILIGIICLILLIAICSVLCEQRETFKAETVQDIQAACLFAVHNFDEDDYRTVKENANDIHFYIINNGPLSEYANKLIMDDNPNVIFHQRDNIGWDLGAWKEGIEKYGDSLSRYTHIIMANNSCIYTNDWRERLVDAKDYDIYGYVTTDILKSGTNVAVLTWFMIISNKLFNDKRFRRWYKDLKPTDREYCLNKHEMVFADHFNKLGFRIGAISYNGKYGNTKGMLKKKERTNELDKALKRWMNDYIPPYVYF